MLLVKEIAAVLSTGSDESKNIDLMKRRDPSLTDEQCQLIMDAVRLELAARMQRELPSDR